MVTGSVPLVVPPDNEKSPSETHHTSSSKQSYPTPITTISTNTARILGRTLRYHITDNTPPGPSPANSVKTRQRPLASPQQVWAINIHGFYAGGGMYAHESRLLADAFGWRVVNPSLPGFGGSQPLPSGHVTPTDYAEVIVALMDHLGISKAILLGHSMGGALAIAVADLYPQRVSGVIYRDGAGTTAWRLDRRVSRLAKLLAPISGALTDLLDTGASFAWEVPSIILGSHKAGTLRDYLPDARHNLTHPVDILPVLKMLFTLDLAAATSRVVNQHHIPVLSMWGVWDNITPKCCAEEFATHSNTVTVWVPGGHAWMLADPWTQGASLLNHPSGQEFLAAITDPPGTPTQWQCSEDTMPREPNPTCHSGT